MENKRRWRSRSADFQSAVSPICNRQSVEFSGLFELSAPAEYNSAIQQIENLRYEKRRLFDKHISCDERAGEGCWTAEQSKLVRAWRLGIINDREREEVGPCPRCAAVLCKGFIRHGLRHYDCAAVR